MGLKVKIKVPKKEQWLDSHFGPPPSKGEVLVSVEKVNKDPVIKPPTQREKDKKMLEEADANAIKWMAERREYERVMLAELPF